MAQKWLKLYEDKTEMVIFSSKHHKKCTISEITIGNAFVAPVNSVRNLGVGMDQHLTIEQQITEICKTCNYQLYKLSSIQRYLTTDATRSAVQALITSVF